MKCPVQIKEAAESHQTSGDYPCIKHVLSLPSIISVHKFAHTFLMMSLATSLPSLFHLSTSLFRFFIFVNFLRYPVKIFRVPLAWMCMQNSVSRSRKVALSKWTRVEKSGRRVQAEKFFRPWPKIQLDTQSLFIMPSRDPQRSLENIYVWKGFLSFQY